MSLYPAPRIVKAELFTRLPDCFRRSQRTSWCDAYRGGMAVHSFLEGPSFDRDGNLYVTDIAHGRIFRITPTGEWTQLADYDGWPNGLKIHKDGRAFIADNRRGILVLDPATGTMNVAVEAPSGESFKGVNDLFFAADGTLYFTDQGQTGLHDPTGRVYRLSTDGRLSVVIATVPSPNGLVMDRAETMIYLAVTRANAVWRLPLTADGRMHRAGLWIQLSGALAGPDGLALDAEGGLLVVHPGLGVWRFDQLGRPTEFIEPPEARLVTNIAFGGAGNRTVFITESETGTILRAELPIAGKSMYSHA